MSDESTDAEVGNLVISIGGDDSLQDNVAKDIQSLQQLLEAISNVTASQNTLYQQITQQMDMARQATIAVAASYNVISNVAAAAGAQVQASTVQAPASPAAAQQQGPTTNAQLMANQRMITVMTQVSTGLQNLIASNNALVTAIQTAQTARPPTPANPRPVRPPVVRPPRQQRQRHIPFIAMRHVMHMAAGSVGMPELGGQLALAMHLGEVMGPAGVVVTGLLSIARGAHDVYEQIHKAHEEQIMYSQEVEKSSRHWAELAQQQVATTAPGHSFAGQISQAREAMVKIREDWLKEGRDFGLGDTVIAAMDVIRVSALGDDLAGKTALELHWETVKKKFDDQKKTLDIAQRYMESQQRIQYTRDSTQYTSDVEGARVNAMVDGPLKRRMEMERSIAEAHRKAQQEEEDHISQMQEAHDQERATGHFNPMKQMNETLQANEHMVNRLQSLDEQAKYQRQGEQRREEEERLQDRYAADNKEIEARTSGFSRSYELLRAHQQQEIESYQKAGKDTVDLVRQQHAAMQVLMNDHLQQLGDKLQDLVDRTMLATRAASPMEVSWTKMARELTREMGLAADELEVFHKAYMDMARAEANKGLVDQFKDLEIQIALSTHQINNLEAAMQKLRRANPDASEDVISSLAQQQEKAWGIDWSKQQIEGTKTALGNAMKLEDYARELKRAVDSGAMSQAQAMKLFRQQEHEVNGVINAGTAQTSWRGGGISSTGAGSLDLRHMNYNIENKKTEGKTLDDILLTLKAIERKETLR